MDIIRKSIISFSLTIILTACGGPTRYINPAANFALIKKVAVIPFDNLTSDRTAGEKVTDIFVTELLAHKLFSVIEYGEVTKALKEKGLEGLKGLSSEQAKVLGRTLGVDGFILGTVNIYGVSRAGSSLEYPKVTFSVRMLEAPSGILLWKATGRGDGLTWTYRLFGLGGKDVSVVTKEVSRQIIATMRVRRPILQKAGTKLWQGIKFPFHILKLPSKIIKK
jgi:TolB-like protein